MLAVTPSRVSIWAARFRASGPELIGERFSWPHHSLKLARTREELVTSTSDGDGHSTTDRTKMLRYRIDTPDGELAVDLPAGRGPAAERPAADASPGA